MPPRRRYKRRRPARRRRYFRRSRNRLGQRSYGPSYGISVFPPRLSCTMKYLQCLDFDTLATGLPAVATFRGNSVFAPFFTASMPGLVGHQPYYYDQIKDMYVHYYVSWSSIRLRIISRGNGTDTQLANAVVVVATNTSSTAPSVQTVIERPGSKHRICGAGGKSYFIKSSTSSRKMLPFRNANQLAFTSTNATDDWYWHVYCQNACDETIEAKAQIEIELRYRVTFYERTTRSGS